MLLPYQIHSNLSLQWWMRMYFFTSHDFGQPKFQLLTHSALEKWSVDISVAGWIQSSQLFTRTKRVWLVQVEITKGVVYYSVMCFVRPERKKLSEMEVAPLLTLFTLFTLRIYCFLCLHCMHNSVSEQMGYYAYTYHTYCYGLYEDLVWWWGWDEWYGIIGRMIYILALDPLSMFRQFDRILPDGQYDIPHKSLVGELPICDSNLGRRQGATNVFFETQTS